MADKATFKQIAALKKTIAAQNAERAEWAENLPGLEEMIAAGEGGEEIITMKNESVAMLAQIDEKLAGLYEELARLEETLPKKPEPEAPKFDPEKHPLLKKAAENAEPAKPIVFNVGDMCEAQWTDRQWYKAKVQMVLGSASAPKYNVRFVDYQDSLTVDRDAIRPLITVNEKKRKAEAAAPTTPTVIPATSSSTVLSGPASINPNAMAAKKEPAPQASGQEKKRKIGGSKALERKAQNWNSFLSKGVGKKVAQKESMFRSGTAAGSKVGFTNSGHGMTETQKRVRYNKNKAFEDDEEGQNQDASGRSRKDDWQSRSRF